MNDRFGVAKMVAFCVLMFVYVGGIIAAAAITGSLDFAMGVALVSGFVVGGLAVAIGVIE